jgi:hypothetical protein
MAQCVCPGEGRGAPRVIARRADPSLGRRSSQTLIHLSGRPSHMFVSGIMFASAASVDASDQRIRYGRLRTFRLTRPHSVVSTGSHHVSQKSRPRFIFRTPVR